MNLEKLLYIFILITLVACEKEGGIRSEQGRKNLQGQATWISKADKVKPQDSSAQPAQKEMAQLNLQKVIEDLQIIPTVKHKKVGDRQSFLSQVTTLMPIAETIPGPLAKQQDVLSGSSAQIMASLDQARLRQETYNIRNIKALIDQIRSEDKKTSAAIQLAQKSVYFENESEKMLQIFRALTNLNGRANVPLLNRSTNKVEKIIEVGIGGELNQAAIAIIQKSKIETCHEVLCALKQLMIQDQSPEIAYAKNTASADDAAYQLIFNALYHRYLIPFYVPRISEYEGLDYQTNLKRFETFNTDQIGIISESLWKLPPSFDQLSGLLYFLADNQDMSRGEVTNSKAIQTVSVVATAHYYWSSHYRPDNNFERWGFVVLENKFWGRFLNDFKIQTESGIHLLTEAELNMFEPDIRKRLNRKHIDTVIHELSHAMDYSDISRNLDVVKNYAYSYPSAFSMSRNWLTASQWSYNQIKSTRQLNSYSKIFLNLMVTPVTIINEWLHGPGSQFINSYSETDPFEDFAVHTAGFVQFPEETMSTSPDKTKFLAQNVFTGVSKGIPFEFKYKKEILSSDRFSSTSALLDEKMYKLELGKCYAYFFGDSSWYRTLNEYCQKSKVSQLSQTGP